ncbi:response regulator transcription factor [Wukongibacter baidiensis]|uniref:response regulator transcription factor n=1 Tax=Wukongibacter baidiensis TaxID=1723361 RepID=UPI003D7FF979
MNILVVEDDKRMNKIICDYLKKDNYTVFSAFDGEEAIEIFETQDINLVLLDIMIPKLDGFSVCKRLRQKSKVLIIILSARSEEADKLMGFEYGADEYVTKPFSPKVLVARAKALLNRTYEKDSRNTIRKGILYIDIECLSVKVEEKPVTLTAREFDLLSRLAQNEGRVYSRDVLINEIWEYDYFGDGRIVDTNIKTLRKKLGTASKYIRTVVGKGYKFEVTE